MLSFEIIKQFFNIFFSFLDEAHGFKKAENKKKALDGEFYFYSKVLKFQAFDPDIEVIFFSFIFLESKNTPDSNIFEISRNWVFLWSKIYAHG